MANKLFFLSTKTIATKLSENKPSKVNLEAMIAWENIVREIATAADNKYGDFDLDEFYSQCNYEVTKFRTDSKHRSNQTK